MRCICSATIRAHCVRTTMQCWYVSYTKAALVRIGHRRCARRSALPLLIDERARGSTASESSALQCTSVLLTQMAACFLALARYDRAIEVCDQALASDPTNAKAMYVLALTHTASARRRRCACAATCMPHATGSRARRIPPTYKRPSFVPSRLVSMPRSARASVRVPRAGGAFSPNLHLWTSASTPRPCGGCRPSIRARRPWLALPCTNGGMDIHTYA